MNEEQKTIDKRALKTLTEEPDSFTLEKPEGGEITLQLYPLQLSRLAMITERLLDFDAILDDGDAENSVKQMWRICAEQPRKVAEVIAIATLRTKREIENELEERTNLIYDSPTMTSTAYATIFSTIVFQSYISDFTKAIRWVRMLQVEISQTTTAERIATTEVAVSGDK